MPPQALLRRLLALSPALLAALLFTILPVPQVEAAVDPAPKVDAAQLREHLDRLDKVVGPAAGVVTGTVAASATGAPITSWVFAFNEADFGGAWTDDNGHYQLQGLSPGEYFISTISPSGPYPYSYLYLDERYDNLPCPRGVCEPASGTLVGVDAGEVTSGIDFALDVAPTISGQVTAASGGAPLPEISISAFDAAGNFVTSAITDGMGAYTLYPGGPGTYFVRTLGFPYFDELYDNLPCLFAECAPTAGTPITIGPGAHVVDIDFALKRLGAISGTVTNALTGSPLEQYNVAIYNAADEWVAGEFFSTASYVVHGIPAGIYYVVVSAQNFLSELYDDLPCASTDSSICDETAGTPVTVELETTVPDIDFELLPLGLISGRVTDAATGDLTEAIVTAWDEHGSQVARVANYVHSATFPYQVALAPGRYYLTASSEYSHLAELYDNLPCPLEDCDPTAGTPVTVDFGSQITGIDFALDYGGSVYGKVTNDLGEPITWATLELWDTDARPLTTTYTNYDGNFFFTGLATGSYFVTTRTHYDPVPYYDEVFDNFPCSTVGGCDPTIGTPIEVTVPTITPNIDFTLTPFAACSASSTALCLNAGRFRVEVDWSDFAQGSGRAFGQQLTGDSGYFTFLDPENVEVVVKVLRACFGPTPRYWVFAGGLTNLEVTMTVTDTLTGHSYRYENPLGTAFELVRDTETFAGCGVGFMETDAVTTDLSRSAWQELVRSGTPGAASSASPGKTTGTCLPDATTLCLRNGRFAVTAMMSTSYSFPYPATAVPLNADTGYFTYFDPDNVEVMVKVLDACGLDPFHNFWVFATGLTDLDVELRVTDTISGEVQVYTNAFGEAFVPIQDTAHFATCP